MKSASFLMLTLASATADVDILFAPGKAVLWSPFTASSSSRNAPEYRTQSIDKNQMEQILNDAAAISEVIAFLKMPKDKSVFSNSFVVESIKASPQATVLPYVYHSEFSGGADMSADLSRSYGALKDAISMSLADFAGSLRRDSDILNNGRVETFEITISGDASDGNYFNDIAKLLASSSFANGNSLSKSPMTFIAMDAPHPQAVQPKQSANYGNILSPVSMGNAANFNQIQNTNGHVSRVLATSNTTSSNTSTSTDNGKGIYYRPEGAEYSIYYASTYLYITPDIFTGIMTGIFVTFTLLIGFSCLGAIQGNDAFANKMPVLGREA